MVVLLMLGGVTFMGWVLMAAWLWLGAWARWTDVAAAAGLCAATTAAAIRFWRRSPAGRLAWDGARWWLEPASAGAAIDAGERAEALMDLQWGMLLCLRPGNARSLWLWLESRQAPQHWPALRCAVYSRALSDASVPQGAGGTFPI